MNRNVLAFVDWDTFRSRAREGRPERSFFFGSKKPTVVKRAGDGGTLWAFTSQPKRKGGKKQYHLAFKLVRCRTLVNPPKYIRKNYGRFVVESMQWDLCEHYPRNDATETLRRLCFRTGKPMAACNPTGWGTKLVTYPELDPKSTALLEGFAMNLMSERILFLSYSHANKRQADLLTSELESRDIKIRRDVNYLEPGIEWKQTLQSIIRGSDIFVIMVSAQASHSKWVRREAQWAISELEQGGLVQRIIPLMLRSGDWNEFPELHQFHRLDWPTRANRKFFDELARKLATIPKRPTGTWDA